MTAAHVRHVFGPVWSRRLGRSLGIDLIPFKTCTFDCVYCQLGRTTEKTATRREYVPLTDVLSEVERKLDAGPAPDFLTLSGSGEPTLYSRIGDLIAALHERTTLPAAVLTNSSLLWDPAVRAEILAADLVLPSLDAGDETIFQHVNRPVASLTLERIVAGLVAFRREFRGPIWLEVFLLGGLTAVPERADDIARIVERLAPDRVQINSVARPPLEEFAFPVPVDTQRQLARRFPGRVEIVAAMVAAAPGGGAAEASDEDILALIRRRPVTLDDITLGLGWPRAEVVKHLDHLTRAGMVAPVRVQHEVYFRPAG